MARVGEAFFREYLRLDLFRGRIRIDQRLHDPVQGDAGDAGLRPAGADPADSGPGEVEGGLRAGCRRMRGDSRAPCSARIALTPGADGRTVGDVRMRLLQRSEEHTSELQ